MKNFTKQNFKTNPLWIRLLIMTFMLLIGTGSAWADKTLYLNAGPWNDDTSAWFEAWAWKNGSNGAWYSVTHISGDYYKFTVPDNVDRIKLLRKGPSHKSNAWESWNETGDISTVSGKELFTINGWSYGSWSAITKSYKLHGEFNNWTDVDFPADINITTLTTYKYKVKCIVKSGDTTIDEEWYGNTGTMTRNSCTDWTMTLGATDCQITADVAGTYTFTFDSSTKKVSVTYPTPTYNITYKDKGNANFSGTHASGAPTTHTFGTPTTLKSPTKTGYNFLGWFTTSACTGSPVTSLGATAYTANITLYAQWELACEKPTAPQLSVNKKINVCEGEDYTYGYIKIDNYASYSNCKFYLGSESNEITNNISGGLIGVNVPNSYKVIVKNDCGSTNEATIDFTATNDLTPAKPTFTVTGNSPICSGEKATLTANVTTTKGEIVSYSWSPSDGTKNDNKYTTPALTKNTSYLGQVKLEYEGCEKTFSATSYTVVVNTAPAKPTITSDKTKVVGSETAKISVSNPDKTSTYTLYKDGAATTRTGTSFDVAAGTYQVKATKSSNAANCKDSELSDKIVIYSCTPNATLVSATYNQSTGKIDLSGNLTETCDKTLFYGFLWKVKGNVWNTDNAISGTGNSYNSTDVSNTVYDQSWDDAVVGTTYVFTAYALDASSGNPSTYVWYYDKTGIEVSKCITIETPNITADPICAGSTATLTLKNKQNGVTYKIDDTPIFTDGTTHTVKPDRTTTYTITATSTISCEVNQTATTTVKVEVKDLPEPPAISSGTTVCPNTQFTLPTIDGDGKWYAQEKGGSAYGSNIITNGVAATTYYYAEAVKNGCSSARRAQYTVNVYTTPATPGITAPESVGQNKDFNVTIGNFNADDNDYALYKGTDKVQDITTGTITLKAPNDLGNVTYTVKAVYKSCAELKSEASFTINVVEAGVQIKFTGDASIDPNDPVDFVSMYVDNDGLGDFAEAGVAVTAYTWEYSTDGNTWTPCASTNTASGITYSVLGMTNGTANCNNFRPSAVGQYRCTVTYNVTSGNNTVSSNILTVKDDATTAKTFKGVTMTLPVISVNTGASKFPVNDFGGTPSKNADEMKKKISVDVKIFDGGKVVYDRKARMNYRGSSSLNFLKKSYAFCPGEEKCGDKKGKDYVKTAALNMLGVGDALDKDWVLYAAAADPSLMRNRLMFDTFADMTGGWSVNSRYVELVVNGEYKGVYVLMDKITVNENRVNVAWKQDASGATTQKGFIVKFDKTDIADRYENTSGDQKTFKSTYSGHDGLSTYDTQIDQRFEIEYPEKEDIEEDDSENGKGPGEWSDVFNTIKEMFNKFEYELAKGNFSEVQKLIDYTSWADWFIITEFGKNIDGYRASNLFVYDEKGSGKIEARPLWDQELSFNNQCPGYYEDYAAASISGLLIKDVEKVYTDNCSAPFWFTGRYTGGRGTYNGSNQTFKGLLDDPCFVAEVKARWAKHVGTNGALTSSALTTKMGGYLKDLDKDHKLNSSVITAGTPLDREFNIFWKNKSRKTIDCVATTGCPTDETGYTDQGFHSSKTSLNNWLAGNRRTNLGNIINGWEGTALSISFAVTPAGGVTTPWEPVMVEVINPSGYEYDFEYTTGDLDQVEGVIIQEDNDKYTYRIPRPSAWGFGDGERDGESYGIKATLKVAEGEAQCGNTKGVPTAEATITLQDEANEDCE